MQVGCHSGRGLYATFSSGRGMKKLQASAQISQARHNVELTYKLTLEYDGSKFSGWQIQNNARTVQGELQRVADELFGVAVDVQGAGRTDAGVHALGQVAHIKVREAKRKYTPAHLMMELNEK